MPSVEEMSSSFQPHLECPSCYTRLVPENGVLCSGIYNGKCKSCNKDVEFWSVPTPVNEVSFTLNGTQHKVTNPDPGMSLNEWIRNQPGLQGTKVMCREAGCGCCVVSVTRHDLSVGKDVTVAVNSCLFPLCGVNGGKVTTIEGIGNRFDGFNPIQERLAEHNGSQCGYCSPGFVMNMYSLLQENPSPSKQQIEDNFDGNICRCTGYRPILDAMKTFAKSENPIDIEEITKCPGVCGNGGLNCARKCLTTSVYEVSGVLWYSPMTLTDLYTLMSKHKNNRIRLVAGNSGKGIYKNDGPFDVMIDITKIEKLHTIPSVTEVPNGDLVIGAAVSLNTLINVLDNQAEKMYGYKVLADHVRKVANVPVRNVASIAGNLMLTHDHPDFPSDIFTILEAAGARLIIADCSTASETQYSLMQFLSLDMTGKVILAVLLPIFTSDYIICTYKVMPRSQNAHAYVNAGFVAKVDKSTMTLSSVRIVYGGVEPHAMHPFKTESFLVGKTLNEQATLAEALTTLGEEIIPDSPPAGASKEYRKSLALGLFYKFYLTVLGDKASARVKSAAVPFIRPVSSGTQDYDTQKKEYPLTKPMTKLAAKLQTSGEAQYISDIPMQGGELHAAFVISTQGNCKIDSYDASEALKMPGVVKFITAADIPKGGINNFTPTSFGLAVEEIFSSGNVSYAGQALGAIIAGLLIVVISLLIFYVFIIVTQDLCFKPETLDTQRHADEAAKAVKVTYKDQEPPLLTIDEAVAAESFFDPQAKTITKGDADTAIKNSPHVIQGAVSTGHQYHFHMETQAALCVPEEDGMTVHCPTQWVDLTQAAVAQTLNYPVQSVNLSVKRCGGAYGARITGANHVATACAIAAYVTKRPVRMRLNLSTNMEMVGVREPYKATYKAGVGSDGKLNGIDVNLYADCGSTPNAIDVGTAQSWVDNAYFCDNWKIVPYATHTNTASNTWCRAPASTQAVFIIETIMEHVAKELKLTPEAVRKVNLYKNGEKTQMGQTLKYCNLDTLWKNIIVSSDFQTRKTAIDTFNKNNRWRKRGISVVPLKYGIAYFGSQFTAMISIYHADGTIAISHGGIEVGQGINTKVAQVVAYQLKCPLDKIAIKPTSAFSNPNSGATGGSITSELCCKTVLGCCDILNKVIDPVRKTMPSASWAEIIAKCFANGADLSAKYRYQAPSSEMVNYNIYGATCVEVEVDVLTGEREIIRADILEDCGQSMNPEIDVGQVEGAFVMGLGLWLTEKFIYDTKTGQNLTNGTWEYKPACSKDIPIEFNVTLLKNAPNPLGILRSKAVGEPPLCMSCACLFAVKHAVEEARAEIGQGADYFVMNAPSMVEDTQLACLVEPSQFSL